MSNTSVFLETLSHNCKALYPLKLTSYLGIKCKYVRRVEVMLPRGYWTGGGGDGGPGAGKGGNGGQGGYGGQGNNKFRKVWKEKGKEREENSHTTSPGEDLLDDDDREDRRKIGSRRNETGEAEKKDEVVDNEKDPHKKKGVESSLQSKLAVDEVVEPISQPIHKLKDSVLNQYREQKDKIEEKSENENFIMNVVLRKGEVKHYVQKEVVPEKGYDEAGSIEVMPKGQEPIIETSREMPQMEVSQTENTVKVVGKGDKVGEETWKTPSDKTYKMRKQGEGELKVQSHPVLTVNRFEVLGEEVEEIRNFQKEVEGQSQDAQLMQPARNSKATSRKKMVETRRSMRVLIKGLSSISRNSTRKDTGSKDPKNIEAVYWSLVAFEGMTGIKVNQAKSELVPINIDQDEALGLAQILGCKLSEEVFRKTARWLPKSLEEVPLQMVPAAAIIAGC